MTFGDIGNGLFELFGGICLWGNVARIRRDKQVKGIDWRVTLFFSSWGFWNLWYYPNLHQWASFTGGLVIVWANATWLFFAFKYRRH